MTFLSTGVDGLALQGHVVTTVSCRGTLNGQHEYSYLGAEPVTSQGPMERVFFCKWCLHLERRPWKVDQ